VKEGAYLDKRPPLGLPPRHIVRVVEVIPYVDHLVLRCKNLEWKESRINLPSKQLPLETAHN